MNIIISFSPTNQSRQVAQYFAKQLSWGLFDLTSFVNQNKFNYKLDYETVIISFPIHSQTIPYPIKTILNKIKSKYFIFLATYGKMGTGDALNDAKRLVTGKVIGAAYIPSKHTYIDNKEFTDYDNLNELISRVNIKEEIIIPKRNKNIFAKFFPNARSRFNVKLKSNDNCNKCDHCHNVCPMNAINKGKINNKCIRCLNCYHECPVKGLNVKYSLFLKMYLKKDKEDRLIIY